MHFEWDPNKDQANQYKYGISFEEATVLFTGNSENLEIYDEAHSVEEDRFIAIGPTRVGVLVVVFKEGQDDVIRILSARKATRKEVRLLHKYLGGVDG